MGKTARVLAQKMMRESTGIDPKFFNQVSQFAHFGMMYFAMTWCAMNGLYLHHYWRGVMVGALFVVAYGTWHEFIWDPTHENVATRGSDLQDFFFLEFGGGAGFFLTWWLLKGFHI